MNVLPVIERELRAESRNAVTYGSRPLGPALLVFASAMFLFHRPGTSWSGRELFTELHQFLLVTIWLWVPIVSADCISREKREQTLGLLFLTPLKAREIMLAKILAQGLRTAAIGLAVIPVLSLPLLLGGVNWPTVLSSVLINSSAFCWALAAGLLASVLARSIVGSLIWALLWSAVFLVVLSILNGIAVFELSFFMTGRARVLPSPEGLAGIGLLTVWQGEPVFFRAVAGLSGAGLQFWIVACALIVFASVCGLGLLWHFGAWYLRRVWQELPPSARRQRIERHFCEPKIAKRAFRSIMRRQLARNPIGWLERRRWTSRAAVWTWMGVFALGYAAYYISFDSLNHVEELNIVMALALLGALALISTASFRRERETGVMELLLTTPLTPEEIVRGRLFGLWAQFLPSFAMFIFMTVFSEAIFNWGMLTTSLQITWVFGAYYLSVSIFGLWFSLAARLYMIGLLVTVAANFLLPIALVNGLQFLPFARINWVAVSTILLVTTIAALVGGAWGLCQLRKTIGAVGLLLSVGGWLLIGYLSLNDAFESWPSTYPHNDWLPVCIVSGFALALAGLSHRMLLRLLRLRRFGFKP